MIRVCGGGASGGGEGGGGGGCGSQVGGGGGVEGVGEVKDAKGMGWQVVTEEV